MSQCIRAGITYKRHTWIEGQCKHCGTSQSKEIFSHALAEGMAEGHSVSQITDQGEALQVPVPQGLERNTILLTDIRQEEAKPLTFAQFMDSLGKLDKPI